MKIEERHAKAVEHILKPLTTNTATQGIFLLWPTLVKITERFCNFISPLTPYDDHMNLVTHSIQNAVRAYRQEKDESRKAASYIIELVNAAPMLASINVQGIAGNTLSTWEPFVEPMSTWMVRNNILTLRTIRRVGILDKKNREIARKALLTHILTADEMIAFSVIL